MKKNSEQQNILLMTDSYKVTHWKQLPQDTTHIFSFFESRGGAYGSAVFFGLQYILKEYLSGPVVTEEKILYAKKYFREHFGSDEYFNEAGWSHILKEWGGNLPLEIRAVDEGTVVPNHNVLMTVVNTDPKTAFLTNYMETILSQVWYPTTVATQSREMKKTILKYLMETGSPDLIDFKLHDFGFRGSTSIESAGLGAAAHLLNFKGTDTLAGIGLAREFYDEAMAGYSIPAAEHSTITSWGKENEAQAYNNMLDVFPTGPVAIVIDSYDIYNALKEIWGKELRQKVLMRDGVVILRPDSGHPPTVVLKVLNILGDIFGYTINHAGYKVLDPHVRIIQGDGIDAAMVETILEAMKKDSWSADNIAFGSGGGLLQKVNRDTLKFAFKCSSVCVSGVWRDVFKDPVTDPGKRSKAGLLKLVKEKEVYKTTRYEDSYLPTELNLVFENGRMKNEQTFKEVRSRAQII